MRAASEKELSELCDEDKWELEQMRKPETDREKLNRLRRLKNAPADEHTSDEDKFKRGLTRCTSKRVVVRWSLPFPARRCIELFACLMDLKSAVLITFAVDDGGKPGCLMRSLIEEGEDGNKLGARIAGILEQHNVSNHSIAWVVEPHEAGS